MLRLALLKKPLGTLLTLTAFLSGCTTTLDGSNPQIASRVYFSHSLPSLAMPNLEPSSDSLATEATINRKRLSEAKLVLFFDNDSAALRDGDLERLQSFLLAYPTDGQHLFIITGHTDDNSSDDYNIHLSERRSKSTQNAMLMMGVPKIQTAIRFLGEDFPVAANSSEEGRQENRRVTIEAFSS